MGAYVRLAGSLVHNLVRRLGEDLADCAAVCKRGLFYKLRSFRLRYDDVGPDGDQEWRILPHWQALLVASVQNKPWFCELDRRTAQDLVHDGTSTTFLIVGLQVTIANWIAEIYVCVENHSINKTLQTSGGSGCFLIRPSASTKSLTLTLWFHHRPYNILIRQREDGLLALGSKKNQEMTFSSVEEMVRYYEREPLILYSGGELTGRTRLKAPPPGLARTHGQRGSTDSESRCSTSSAANRRTSAVTSLEDTDEFNRSAIACSRTMSSGQAVVLSPPITKRLATSEPNMEEGKVSPRRSLQRISTNYTMSQFDRESYRPTQPTTSGSAPVVIPRVKCPSTPTRLIQSLPHISGKDTPNLTLSLSNLGSSF